MRAARRLVNLATQSPNPYFSGISIGWPGRPSGTVWPTNRTENGVGRSNFKPSPPKKRLRKKQGTTPHPNLHHNIASIYFVAFRYLSQRIHHLSPTRQRGIFQQMKNNQPQRALPTNIPARSNLHGYAQYLEQQLGVRIPISQFRGDIHLSETEDARRWLAIPDDPPLPRNWRSWVNKVETEAELNSLRHSVKRGLPSGDDNRTKSSAARLGLETTTRSRGRPKKET